MAPSYFSGRKSRTRQAAAAVAIGGTLALLALLNRTLAARAEQDNPARGNFIEVDGIRLHYLERGRGEPLVLLHGNGSMIEDFESSGLIAQAARKYRVIVFDRPGYGHSERPRNVVWTPGAQARLIYRALNKMGVSNATVLGHSWGTSVAIALALKYPTTVHALVLASGYYFPTARADVFALSGPAVPIVGDLIRYTLSPVLGRLMWPLMMRKIFGPAHIPKKFEEGFPRNMALRPSQIRASAAEAALMLPDAISYQGEYARLTLPVVIIAGAEDRLIKTERQSARLHREIPQSTFHRVTGGGHMIHQTHTERVMAAIDEAADGTEYRDQSKPTPRVT